MEKVFSWENLFYSFTKILLQLVPEGAIDNMVTLDRPLLRDWNNDDTGLWHAYVSPGRNVQKDRRLFILYGFY